MNEPIYLDYNGTTPHDPEVIETIKKHLEEDFGNPSSSHWYGILPKKAVREARGHVANLLGCEPEEVLFTSGGTESNNHAIRGIAHALSSKGNHIVTTQIEHPAITEVCRFLETKGFEITYLPVTDEGRIELDSVAKAIRPETILISVMHANNETGVIQPIAQIAELAQKHGTIFHTDAAQSVGKISVKVKDLGVDLLSIAGHKLYAPKGIGALYIRKGTPLTKFMFGAGQESGRRAGTENVMHIAGLGKACEIAQRDFEASTTRMRSTRDLLYKLLSDDIRDMRVNGFSAQRLPNTLSISFRGLEANRILEEIGLEVAASAGAACHSDTVVVSHVLEAMRVPLDWAKGTIRFSTGKYTTETEIKTAARIVIDAVKLLGA